MLHLYYFSIFFKVSIVLKERKKESYNESGQLQAAVLDILKMPIPELEFKNQLAVDF